MSDQPPTENPEESSGGPRDNPFSDEASAEMRQLEEAARVARWVEIARANLDQQPVRHRRFGRRKP
jgi:hypothetical protein